eukprot:gene20105-26103_t
MFGGIFVKKSNENEESNNKIISNSDNNISLDFEADVGGCKGWFKNTCTVIYHSHQALICIGTVSGGVCVYGSDFQLFKSVNTARTTEGDFYVIHATDTSLRICDYTLTSAQVGVIDKDMILTDIHICPKDERYIALSYEGPNDDIGSVVIFDLKKKLPFKQYRTTAITSLAWNHTGDFLYAGTRIGELLSMTIEKSPSTIYNTNSELINTEDLPIAIRKILWLGLANITNKPGEMSQVFALPPLINEYILGFRLIPLIPTAESSKSMQLASLSIDSNDNTSYHPLLIPGLLLLTEVKENNVTTRHLKVQSCPATNISNWPLSIGQLDPMEKVIPVLGSNSLFTTIVGITPTSNLSFGNIVIQLTQRGNEFGYVDSQKKSYKKKSHNRHNKEELLDILSKQDFIDDDEDDDASEESEEEEDNNDNYIPIFQPNDIRYNQKINVPDQITYLTIISEINIIVIGTNNGELDISI